MILVYVWRPLGALGGVSGASVGHGSMLVLPDPGRPARGRYISWWPLAVSRADAITNADVPAYANTWDEDRRDMHRPVDRCFRLNATGRDFDETAIVAEWDRSVDPTIVTRERPAYRALDRNCCSTVMRLLFGAGGGARYRGYGPIPATWWAPNDVEAWMEAAARRGIVTPLASVQAPPGGVPAVGREHVTGATGDRLTGLGRRHATMAPARRR